MKFEALCTNEHCIGYGFRLLLEAAQLRRFLAVDADGNDVRCPFCDSLVKAMSVSATGALFPVGEVKATDAAKRVLSFAHPDDPLEWMVVAEPLMKRHMRGDHGSVTQEVLDSNRHTLVWDGALAQGKVVSMYVVNREPLWFVTNNTRTETLICLPEEYGAVTAG